MIISSLILSLTLYGQQAADGAVHLDEGQRATLVDSAAAIGVDRSAYFEVKAALAANDEDALRALAESGKRAQLPAGTLVEVVRDLQGQLEIRCVNGPLPPSQLLVLDPQSLKPLDAPAGPYDDFLPDPAYVPRVGDQALLTLKPTLLYTSEEALAAARAKAAAGQEVVGPDPTMVRTFEKGTPVRVLRILGSPTGRNAGESTIEVVVLSGTYKDQRFFAARGSVGRLTARQGVTRAPQTKRARPAADTTEPAKKADPAKRAASLLAQAGALEKTNRGAALKLYDEIIALAPDSPEAAQAKTRKDALQSGQR